MGGVGRGVCAQADPAAYESFFQQVVRFAQFENPAGTVLLNGQPAGVRQYTLKDALDLTDEESQVLNTLAAGCESKLRSFEDRARPSTFEARLRLIEKADPRATHLLNQVDNQRRQIVLDHVQQLRAAFGDSRFSALDAFVRSGKPVVSYFPQRKTKVE
jgi:hypothetical protein